MLSHPLLLDSMQGALNDFEVHAKLLLYTFTIAESISTDWKTNILRHLLPLCAPGELS